MGLLKDAASILIDIYGQNEHQTLLNRKNHLAILDLYAGDAILPLKEQVKSAYNTYSVCEKKLKEASLDEESRRKEVSFLEFEIHEIEQAELQDGEDELLEETYRRMSDSRKLTEGIAEAYQYTSDGEGINASDALSRAIRALQDVSDYDEKGSELYHQLVEVDSLLNDFNRELAEYGKSFEFSDEEFQQTEQRLNELNRLKAKYGNSVDEILEYYEAECEKLNVLQNYDNYIEELELQQKEAKEKLDLYSQKLGEFRREDMFQHKIYFFNKLI